MKLWARVFLGYFLVVGLTGWFLLRAFVSEVKPGVRDAVEDVMVDTAHLLAEIAREDFISGHLSEGRFAKSVETYRKREVRAPIWGLKKQTLDFRIYVTDAAGIVRYDSEHRALGEDYSQWRDVHRTLRGDYGSRSTKMDPENPRSGVMHVAAAIIDSSGGEPRIIGVLTVAKPSVTLLPIIQRGEQSIQRQGLLLLAASLTIGAIFTVWLTLSMNRLVRYARLLAAGSPASPPSRGNDEIGELARALAHLRNELDGRAYVEHYVQHLTHEMKSPLAAIRGASELLAEANLPPADRERFTDNIKTQSERLHTLIEKLLRLAQIERQRELESPVSIDVANLFRALQTTLGPQATQKEIRLRFSTPEALWLRGERFLMELALSNLIQNAIDFSPPQSTIWVTASEEVASIIFAVRDEGPGIPEFAKARLFERFFSLPRPNGEAKSTGLGLPLVYEVALLHQGRVSLDNHPEGGSIALLSIPRL